MQKTSFNFPCRSARGLYVVLAATIFLLGGCTDEESPVSGNSLGNGLSSVSITDVTVPNTYTFTSRFVTGESSVSYSGQTLRHILIADLKNEIDGLTPRVNNSEFDPGDESKVKAGLMFYYEFDADTNGDIAHSVSTDPNAKQQTYGEIGSANLKGKIAGNDPEGQHKDWSQGFVGWSQTGVVTPEDLVLKWFDELSALAVSYSVNGPASDPTGVAIDKGYVSPQGLDYKNLIQKFLDGAVVYSQGSDDYLDNDTDGKGLTVQNAEPDKDGAPYSSLERHWDEGFGYFGAARDYGAYTDEQIAGGDQIDTNVDGTIDLKLERNFGHSVNAGKRDKGSADAAKTDFTKGAWEAFLTGRALIAAVEGPLTTTQMTELVAMADQARLNWELAIAATAIHYINVTLADMTALEDNSSEYKFSSHAAHWSELKGFALSLQFNPQKMISDAKLEELHDLIGQAPALTTGTTGFDGYKTKLLDARDILKDAYGFADANVTTW